MFLNFLASFIYLLWHSAKDRGDVSVSDLDALSVSFGSFVYLIDQFGQLRFGALLSDPMENHSGNCLIFFKTLFFLGLKLYQSFFS